MNNQEFEKLKTGKYQKNKELEGLIKTINKHLKPADRSISREWEISRNYPIFFIVGVPRSGTTLLTQWLASLNIFCYPTNFISRFYEAPVIGAMIQEMVFDSKYNYKDELSLTDSNISFKSDLGKTTGFREPHEFWYFWRRFFTLPEVPDKQLFRNNAKYDEFVFEINKLQSFYKRPFFIKSQIINYYIEFLDKNIDNAVFLFVERDPIDNMRSLIKSRREYFGEEKEWFSFKPHEYNYLKNKDAVAQVAGQVYYINKEIKRQLSNIINEKKVTIKYEEFCNDTSGIMNQILEKLKNHYVEFENIGEFEKKFDVKKYEKDDLYEKFLNEWNELAYS